MKIFRSSLLLIAPFLVSGLFAQEPLLKIGFVNPQAVLAGTQEGQQQQKEMQAFASTKENEIKSKQEALQTVQQEYRTKLGVLNEMTRREMETDIERKTTELKRLQEDIQAELQRKNSEALASISQKLQGVITEYAEANKFGAVMLLDPQLEAYVHPSLDMTEDIIRIYNERYPVAAAAAQ